MSQFAYYVPRRYIQNPGDTWNYTVDLTKLSSTGWAVTASAGWDITDPDNHSDDTGTIISGSASVSGATLTTADVTALTLGQNYEIRTTLTNSANTHIFSVYVDCRVQPLKTFEMHSSADIAYAYDVDSIASTGWAWSATSLTNITDPDNHVADPGTLTSNGDASASPGKVITPRVSGGTAGQTWRMDTTATNAGRTRVLVAYIRWIDLP